MLLLPDGIERCWAICKHSYRRRLAHYRVNQIPFDNRTVVQQTLTELESTTCQRIASAGWAALLRATPMQPEAPRLPPAVSINDINDDPAASSRVAANAEPEQEAAEDSSDSSQERLLRLRQSIRELLEEMGLE